jgi:hypothetical protein
MAFCEASRDQSLGTAASMGDSGYKELASSDPAEKDEKHAVEIANGRLAMMAIFGCSSRIYGYKVLTSSDPMA